jgi:putative FmdB family regulatory protein
MPTYDYQCRSCGAVTEVIHSMLEEGPKVCERCGGELRRVLYPTGIIFKGSGFYKTDSRGAAPGSGAASTAAASDGGASSPGGKTEPGKTSPSPSTSAPASSSEGKSTGGSSSESTSSGGD